MPGSIMGGGGYFLKIDGISGESADAKHKDEIELVGFTWGLEEPTASAGSGSGAGRAKFKDFSFLMRVNKASPILFLSAATSKHLKWAALSVRSHAAFDWLKVKFTDVLITSYEQAADEEDDPHEAVAFDFGKIEVEYTPQSAAGTAATPIKAGWDLKQNVKI
jgi:type VI secretion system secreted protein Hcp